MFRTLTTLALLALAVPATALAGDPDLKAQKQEVKAAKTYSKQVDKAVKKWEKGAEKGNEKKMARADEDLDQIVRDELARLRDLGVKTRVTEPEPINKKYPGKTIVLAPEHPKLEALRDDLVELRDLQPWFEAGKAKNRDFTRKSELLSELSENVADRYERADRQYDAAKAG